MTLKLFKMVKEEEEEEEEPKLDLFLARAVFDVIHTIALFQ
jgi:hypothetical protein